MDLPTPLLSLGERSLPLLNVSALRRLEHTYAPGILMERAGLAVAKLARALWPSSTRATVVCGPGDNGGDGLVAARLLKAQGVAVQCVLVGHPRLASVARQQAEIAARTSGLSTLRITELDAEADFIVDALLGLGLRSAPEDEMLAAINALNNHSAPKLGVDLPSGLLADTGHAPGAVVRCAHTLSLLAPTPGLFTGLGRQHCGRLWLHRLGSSAGEAALAFAGSPRQDWRRHSIRARLPHGAHKGSAGRVWALQGAVETAGAARLAARAALAAGAGRVYLTGDAVDADPVWPELMRIRSDAALNEVGGGVGVVGCGGGIEVAEQLPSWLERAAQLVVDADALNAVADSPSLLRALARRRELGQRSVITPHPLEAARLLGSSVDEVQADRLSAAHELVSRVRCTVVLKGSGSVIACPESQPRINSSGHAALGTAGSGDVLSGWLGGLMAQAPEAPLHDLAAIACAWQGEAADHWPAGGGPLRASDLIAAMAALHA